MIDNARSIQDHEAYYNDEPGMDKNIREENNTPSIEERIDKLPESFPQAAETIEKDVAPLLITMSEGLRDHYYTLIKKQTNAASKRSVKILIEDAIERINGIQEQSPAENGEGPDNDDPEILKRVEEINKDPQLFKKQIDVVGQLGVEGERKNTGLYSLIINSSKLPMVHGGSEALAGKNSGPQGSGKSHSLFTVLKLHPQSGYHLTTSGSAKSLFNMKDTLKHKALILTEALPLEGKNGDNELAYSIRSLISEGVLKYQYTAFEDNEKVTKTQVMEGPTSLLTTTIKGDLEDQLEDRLITLHPNTSASQTRSIISKTAYIASGHAQVVDEKELITWRTYHSLLVPVEVIIPFADELSSHVNNQGFLPLGARRAFKRVISAIKTVALMYQNQRKRDDDGNVIAEISDYAIVYQLILESFRESLGYGKIHTDDRLRLIESVGVISVKKLAERVDVSVPAISQWMKPWIEKGMLVWCDQSGDEFRDIPSMEKAKRTGDAYVRIRSICGLPSPYRMTNDERWKPGGELYEIYDLELDEKEEEIGLDGKELLPGGESENGEVVSSPGIGKESETQPGDGVKALGEKAGIQNKNDSMGNKKPRIYNHISLEQWTEDLNELLTI